MWVCEKGGIRKTEIAKGIWGDLKIEKIDGNRGKRKY